MTAEPTRDPISQPATLKPELSIENKCTWIADDDVSNILPMEPVFPWAGTCATNYGNALALPHDTIDYMDHGEDGIEEEQDHKLTLSAAGFHHRMEAMQWWKNYKACEARDILLSDSIFNETVPTESFVKHPGFPTPLFHSSSHSPTLPPPSSLPLITPPPPHLPSPCTHTLFPAPPPPPPPPQSMPKQKGKFVDVIQTKRTAVDYFDFHYTG